MEKIEMKFKKMPPLIDSLQADTEYLLSIIPDEQKKSVFSQDMCDIDSTFVGFTFAYKALSMIIPKDFTIVDLGCAYNPQCFYFKDFEKYIAVDILAEKIFKTDNCDFYQMNIVDYLKLEAPKLNMSKTFAICNYVPEWYGFDRKTLSSIFKNLYVFYP